MEGVIEAPVITIDDVDDSGKRIVVHNYINTKGKMVLGREEACLLLLELYKFVHAT